MAKCSILTLEASFLSTTVTMPTPENDRFNAFAPGPFFGNPNMTLSLPGKILGDTNSARPQYPSVDFLHSTDKGHVEAFVKSLNQGNPRDGIQQVAARRSGMLGETVATCGYHPDKGPIASIGHGSQDLKLKYREAPDHSAVFLERKVNTPIGTGYLEGGVRHSNGILGYLFNLTFR